MSDVVYYEKPVLLHRDSHRRVKVARSASFAFARKANSMYLAGAEFSEAGKEYAIVFTRVNGKKVVPVAMLGLRARENLFVDAQSRWTSTYVPAFVRRYPFVLSELQGGQLGVCIDEAYTGFNDPSGEPLFDEHGQQHNANGGGNAQGYCQVNKKCRQRNEQHANQNDQTDRHDNVFGAH